MGDATWGGKAIPLGKRAYMDGGRLASVASWGEGDSWSRTKWGWEGEQKDKRKESETQRDENGLGEVLYLVVFRTLGQSLGFCPTILGRGLPCPKVPPSPAQTLLPAPRSLVVIIRPC